MRVLFVFPIDYMLYPFNVGMLSAFLKAHNHETRLFMPIFDNDTLLPEDYLQAERDIESFKPDLVAFSSYEMSFNWIKTLSDFIKKKYGLPIIVGGYHATLAPQEVIDHPSIDIVCRGEGEYAILELVENLEKGKGIEGIQSLWVKREGKIFRNPQRPLIENLDELPFPDREIMDFQGYLDLKPRGVRILEVMGSRGCPFSCTYCSNHAFIELYPNKDKYVRYRSIENILNEIELLSSRYKFERIGFHDDTFILSKKWFAEFCEKYPKRFSYPFSCNVRPENCSIENLSMLKKANCYEIDVGVESGDEVIRKHVLNRRISDKQIRDAFKNAKQVGLQTKSFCMVGIPFETRVSIFKTIMLNFRLAPDAVQTSVFYPFKGTTLGDLCYKMGLVDHERVKTVKTYVYESVLNLPNISQRELKFYKYVNSLNAFRSGNVEIIKMAYNSLRNATRYGSVDRALIVAQHFRKND